MTASRFWKTWTSRTVSTSQSKSAVTGLDAKLSRIVFPIGREVEQIVFVPSLAC